MGLQTDRSLKIMGVGCISALDTIMGLWQGFTQTEYLTTDSNRCVSENGRHYTEIERTSSRYLVGHGY